MGATPGELESNDTLHPGFNLAPANNDPLADFNMLKTWAPQAMNALRKSNLRTNMVNPPEDESKKSSGTLAKGIISGWLN